MNLLFDIDNVIRDWTRSVLKVLDQFGHELKSFTDCKSYNIEDWFKDPLPKEEIYELVFNHWAEPIYMNADPIPGAITALNNLYFNGHTVILVSNQFSSNLQQYTDQWLEDHNVMKSGVIYTSDKSMITGTLLVDDYDKNLIVSPAQNRLFYHRPWNESKDNFKRFYDWNEIQVWINLKERGVI